MSVTPGTFDLTIYIGVDFSQTFVLSDGLGNLTDLTGASAALNMFTQAGYPTPFVTLTTENGGITFDYNNGVLAIITPFLAGSATAMLTAQCGFYNLEVTSSGGFINRILQGCVSISV